MSTGHARLLLSRTIAAAGLLIALGGAAQAGTASLSASKPTVNILQFFENPNTSANLAIRRLNELTGGTNTRGSGQIFQHNQFFQIEAITFLVSQADIYDAGTHVIQMALMKDTTGDGTPESQAGPIETFDMANMTVAVDDYITFALDSPTELLDRNTAYCLEFWWTTDDASHNLQCLRSNDTVVDYANGAYSSNTDRIFPFAAVPVSNGRDWVFYLQGTEQTPHGNDDLTITGADVTPTNPIPAAVVPALSYDLAVTNAGGVDVALDGVTVTIAGAGADSEISEVRMYTDVDDDGSAEGETILGAAPLVLGQASIVFTDTQWITSPTVTNWVLAIVFDATAVGNTYTVSTTLGDWTVNTTEGGAGDEVLPLGGDTSAQITVKAAPVTLTRNLLVETWEPADPALDWPARTADSGAFDADNTWNYLMQSGCPHTRIIDPGDPNTDNLINGNRTLAGAIASGTTEDGTGTPDQAQFYADTLEARRVGHAASVTIQFDYELTAPSNNGEQNAFVDVRDVAGDNRYRIRIQGDTVGPGMVQFEVRTQPSRQVAFSTAASDEDVRHRVTATFTKSGGTTIVDYKVENIDTPAVREEGTFMFNDAIADDIELTSAAIVFEMLGRVALDDIAITADLRQPTLVANPEPVTIYAMQATTDETTLTLSNASLLDLTVTGASITDNPLGAFYLPNGDISSPQTITSAGGAQPELPVLVAFNASTSGLSQGEPPLVATLTVVSDTEGFAGTPVDILVEGHVVKAEHFTWEGADDVWTSFVLWDPDGVPAREDTARIGSGVVTRETALVVDAASVSRDNAVTSLALTGGELRIINNANFVVAAGGTAQFTQEGGTISAGNVNIANGAGGNGTYILQDGEIRANGELRVGGAASSQGSLDITTGTVLTTGGVFVAYGTTSTASLVMNGGVMDAFVMRVGWGPGSTGEWTQTGGVLNVPDRIHLAYDTGSAGTVNLEGGTVNHGFEAGVSVGRWGVAEWNQSGGVLKTNRLRIGEAPGGLGSLNLSGGDIVINEYLSFGGADTASGSMDMSGGTISAANITTGAGAITGWNWTGGTIEATTISLPIAMTNDGGVLSPGGDGIGQTIFPDGGLYRQNTSGSLAIDIEDIGVADQLIMTSSVAVLAGTIDVSLTGAEPAAGGSWDVVVAQGIGSLDTSATAFNLPGPAPYWEAMADAAKVTITFNKPPRLDAPTTASFTAIDLSKGQSASTKVITLKNIGDFDLGITTMTVIGTNFTLIQPLAADLPTTLTPGSTGTATVIYEGTTTGTFIGLLTIESNDPDSPARIGLQVRVIEEQVPGLSVKAWRRY